MWRTLTVKRDKKLCEEISRSKIYGRILEYC